MEIQYLQLKISGRTKKNVIAMLIKDGVEIKRDDELIKHVTKYYKDLSRALEICNISFEGLECKIYLGHQRYVIFLWKALNVIT